MNNTQRNGVGMFGFYYNMDKSDIKDGSDGKEGKDDGISWGRIGPTERHDS